MSKLGMSDSEQWMSLGMGEFSIVYNKSLLILRFKTTPIYYFIVSVGQKPGHGIAESRAQDLGADISESVRS